MPRVNQDYVGSCDLSFGIRVGMGHAVSPAGIAARVRVIAPFGLCWAVIHFDIGSRCASGLRCWAEDHAAEVLRRGGAAFGRGPVSQRRGGAERFMRALK